MGAGTRSRRLGQEEILQASGNSLPPLRLATSLLPSGGVPNPSKRGTKTEVAQK